MDLFINNIIFRNLSQDISRCNVLCICSTVKVYSTYTFFKFTQTANINKEERYKTYTMNCTVKVYSMYTFCFLKFTPTPIIKHD